MRKNKSPDRVTPQLPALYAHRGTQRDRAVPHNTAESALAAPPYFHDGSAETLEAVVEHLRHSPEPRSRSRRAADLVEYLKSL